MTEYRSLHQLRADMLLTQQESLLIQLLFGKENPAKEAELYQELVFDDQKQSFLLLLARLSDRSGYACVPDHLVPRLKGLLRYHSVNDRMKMQPVAALLDCLEDQPAMLYGHSAMYVYYDREKPRIMGIGDICIAPDELTVVLSAAEAAGFRIQSESSLAALLIHEKGNVNLHKSLHIPSEQHVWRRSETVSFQNRSVQVPDCTDTLILLLRTALRWYSILPMRTDNLKWHYDCACLLQHPDFQGWEVLAERAKVLDSLQTVGFMLDLFNRSVPGWIPEAVWAMFGTEDNGSRIAPALNYGAMTKRYEAAKKNGFAPRMVWWLPWMWTKYNYMNSEISGYELPVSLARALRLHWGVSSLLQLPKLFFTRMTKRKRGNL